MVRAALRFGLDSKLHHIFNETDLNNVDNEPCSLCIVI